MIKSRKCNVLKKSQRDFNSSREFRDDKLIIKIRLFGSLCDLTSGKNLFEFDPGINQTIKDCIERLGVPHTEVFFITMNGNFVDFSKIVCDGDFYCVYPECDLPVEDRYILTPKYLGEPKFVADIHLGKLVKYLRMLGISTVYGIIDDKLIISKALETNSIILTRDRNMLKENVVKYGYVLRSDVPKIQLKEIIFRYDLIKYIKPFTRCMECNGKLVPVLKAEIVNEVPERVLNTFNEFARCSNCGKIYWGGSHYQNMSNFIRQFLNSL